MQPGFQELYAVGSNKVASESHFRVRLVTGFRGGVAQSQRSPPSPMHRLFLSGINVRLIGGQIVDTQFRLRTVPIQSYLIARTCILTGANRAVEVSSALVKLVDNQPVR